MAERDLYELLGVQRNASPEALKRAYRRLVKELHPDRHPGDAAAAERFKEINAAYDVLKDPRKRAVYDRLGHAGLNGSASGHGGGAYAGGDLGDVLSSLFGEGFGEVFGEFVGGGGRSGRQRGQDLTYSVEIDLEEAFRGKELELRIPGDVPCAACGATGSVSRKAPQSCGPCGGRGSIRRAHGFMTVEHTCPTCRGQGKSIQDPCSACGGAGRRRGERDISVRIPAGIPDGGKLKMANKGEAGMLGGPPGDLYLEVSIAEHPRFRRAGDHLRTDIDIPMTLAALGGAVEAVTIDGVKAKVKVPAGTQSGSRLRIRQKGMPNLRTGDRGDLFLDVLVNTPTRLSRRQRKLLEEFAELSGER